MMKPLLKTSTNPSAVVGSMATFWRAVSYSAPPRTTALICSYSYDHAWVNLPEHTTHIFVFANGNKLKLSNRRLYVDAGNQQTSWRIKDVKKVSFAHKKFILPIITGGITLPFAVLAIHAHVINYWLGVVFGLIGLMLVYYGFLGNYQLTIHTATHLFHLFTGEEKDQVAAAVEKVNNALCT